LAPVCPLFPYTTLFRSRAIKQVIGKALMRTGDPSLLPFKLHDFGFRGVSSKESAAIGGAAHLLNFLGTDTLAAIQLLNQFYSARSEEHTSELQSRFDLV